MAMMMSTNRDYFQSCVEIEWVDSISDSDWDGLKTALREATVDSMRQRSVGYLLVKTKDFILIAGNRSEDGTKVSHTMQIPRKAVLALRKLTSGDGDAH